MVWKLLPTLSAPMPLQMALDEQLFLSQKIDPQSPVLRFYVSSSPWISVGYSFREEADLAKSGLISKSSGLPTCRRLTGGGCVLHGCDLIFSLVARLQTDPENLGSVRTSYAKIHESVSRGLKRCGLDPKFYAAEEDLHVEDRIDRDARLANVSDNSRMVGVVAAMRGQIECDREPLLPGGDVALVECV